MPASLILIPNRVARINLAASIEDSGKRLTAVKNLIAANGGRVKSVHMTMGCYDLTAIIESLGNESIVRIALTWPSRERTQHDFEGVSRGRGTQAFRKPRLDGLRTPGKSDLEASPCTS